jgi:hypothetical protein
MRTITGTFTITTDTNQAATMTITEEGSVPLDVTSWDLVHLIARLDKYRPEVEAKPAVRKR